jgi:hypothetical protein
MDDFLTEYLTWFVAIVVVCIAIWAVSVYRSKKRASRGGCILCGEDLGHKSDAEAVNDVLIGDSQYTISSTWRTAEYIKQVRKVMCLSCSRKTVRDLYVRCVAYMIFTALFSAGLLYRLASEAMAGRFDFGPLLAAGIGVCGLHFLNVRAKYCKAALKSISKAAKRKAKEVPEAG